MPDQYKEARDRGENNQPAMSDHRFEKKAVCDAMYDALIEEPAYVASFGSLAHPRASWDNVTDACLHVLCTRYKRRAPRMGEMVTVIVKGSSVAVDMGSFLQSFLNK
jgi:hypothetical protein